MENVDMSEMKNECNELSSVTGSTQRIENDLAHAQQEFNKWSEAAIEASKGVSAFYEHNEASYWKGRRDALRNLLSNSESSRTANNL